jgi:hypothetical protein
LLSQPKARSRFKLQEELYSAGKGGASLPDSRFSSSAACTAAAAAFSFLLLQSLVGVALPLMLADPASVVSEVMAAAVTAPTLSVMEAADVIVQPHRRFVGFIAPKHCALVVPCTFVDPADVLLEVLLLSCFIIALRAAISDALVNGSDVRVEAKNARELLAALLAVFFINHPAADQAVIDSSMRCSVFAIHPFATCIC